MALSRFRLRYFLQEVTGRISLGFIAYNAQILNPFTKSVWTQLNEFI